MDLIASASLLSTPESFAGALVCLFALVIGHAISDFALQGEFVSVAKNRNAELQKYFGDGPAPKGVWICVLTAHSLIHAGLVWWITGSVILAFIEFALHAWIDFIKCEGKTTFLEDQMLHVLCKVAYVFLLWFAGDWVMWAP